MLEKYFQYFLFKIKSFTINIHYFALVFNLCKLSILFHVIDHSCYIDVISKISNFFNFENKKY